MRDCSLAQLRNGKQLIQFDQRDRACRPTLDAAVVEEVGNWTFGRGFHRRRPLFARKSDLVPSLLPRPISLTRSLTRSLFHSLKLLARLRCTVNTASAGEASGFVFAR